MPPSTHPLAARAAQHVDDVLDAETLLDARDA